MAEFVEIRVGDKLINAMAIGSIPVGWNEVRLDLTPEVRQFITASGISDQTEIDAVNTLYKSLDTDGLIDKMYAIYPFVGTTETAHSVNLIATASYELTFNGTWAHSPSGSYSNGTDAYADTQFLFDTPNWLTSASLGIYSQTTGSSGYDMGAMDNNPTPQPGAQTGLIAKFIANDNFYPAIPIGDIQYSGSHDGSGLYVSTRNNTGLTGSIDGTEVIQGAQAAIETPDFSLKIAAITNKDGNQEAFSERLYGLALIGGGLTTTDQANLYTHVQTFQTSLGRQV